MQAIVDERKAGGAVKKELGETARLYTGRMYKVAGDSPDSIIAKLQVGSLEQREAREKGVSWLAKRVNTFVNVLRPRMRSLAADYQLRAE